jgi:hypothetical protein
MCPFNELCVTLFSTAFSLPRTFIFFLSSIRPGGLLQSYIFLPSLHWTSDWPLSSWLITQNWFWCSSCIHTVHVVLPFPLILLNIPCHWFNF